MRLAMQCLKCSALVGLLGMSVWLSGCAEQAAPPTITPSGNGGGQAGSTLGGGVDVPMPESPADTGAEKPADSDAKPAEEKPAEEKPADAKPEEKPAEDKKSEEK